MIYSVIHLQFTCDLPAMNEVWKTHETAAYQRLFFLCLLHGRGLI